MRTGLAAVNSKHPRKPPIDTKSDRTRSDRDRTLRAPVRRDRKDYLAKFRDNKFDPRQIETLWREDRRIRQSKKNTGRFS